MKPKYTILVIVLIILIGLTAVFYKEVIYMRMADLVYINEFEGHPDQPELATTKVRGVPWNNRSEGDESVARSFNDCVRDAKYIFRQGSLLSLAGIGKDSEVEFVRVIVERQVMGESFQKITITVRPEVIRYCLASKGKKTPGEVDYNCQHPTFENFFTMALSDIEHKLLAKVGINPDDGLSLFEVNVNK